MVSVGERERQSERGGAGDENGEGKHAIINTHKAYIMPNQMRKERTQNNVPYT